jgi:aspartate-semialdehyde dehydrogenase
MGNVSNKINIAVVGGTGVVGETIVELLPNCKLEIDKLYVLASANSIGKSLTFRNKKVFVEELSDFDFSCVQLALFAAGQKVSKEYCPKAVESGCYVIDNSSAYRSDPKVPLIVPEVNAKDLVGLNGPSIIANPNCSTIQMTVALEPFFRLFGIKRVNVSTYQSVSGTGRKAISELISQTTSLLNGKFENPKVYSKQIAFNAIPHIDEFLDNEYTKEEMKMFHETQKIFNSDDILVNATAVRIPTIFGHAESINVETKEIADIDILKKEYKKAPGVILLSDKEKYPTCLSDAVGKLEVFIGRLRRDITLPNGVNLWVVADNIRKGAAWNAIQIAELLFVK